MDLLGKEYRSFDGMRRWELLYEDMLLVILDTGVTRSNDCNFVGIDANDLRVKWALAGSLKSDHQYDGIVNVWIKHGNVWVGSWVGTARRIDHRTGTVLEEIFTK